MIVVTGGAGFIGSNIVRGLNRQGETEILVVDDLRDGWKCRNLTGCRIDDYLDKDRFLQALQQDDTLIGEVDCVMHQGACTSTVQWDGRLMMDDNYQYSKELLARCAARRIPLIYASSAAIYGDGGMCREEPACEQPLTLYAWSKWLFDRHVRRVLPAMTSQIVGLRYFNVYGPREAHKGSMASMVLQLHRQVICDGKMRLFGASHGRSDGEQRRDFVYVDDVVAANLWFLRNPQISGIFNVGTGRGRTFNELARAIATHHAEGTIEYIAFPTSLRGLYQNDTQADLTRLRSVGCDIAFRNIEQGVEEYVAWLEHNDYEPPVSHP